MACYLDLITTFSEYKYKYKYEIPHAFYNPHPNSSWGQILVSGSCSQIALVYIHLLM
jgi:hypothetical protein